MCYVIYHTHNECEHDRKVEVIEFCENSEEGTCVHIPVHFKRINSPSLCVSCFREEEAKIDAVYNARSEVLRRSIAEHEAAQADTQIRGRAQGPVDRYIAQLERELVGERESRDLMIQMFRSEQGVWADG